MNNRVNIKSAFFYNWVLFFINPFVSMVLSFRDYSAPYAKNLFWAFCVFYGLTFAIGNESSGNDIIRYLVELQRLHLKTDFTVSDAILYFKESGEVDFIRITISYIISRFTDSQAVLTIVYAIIFGFFYSRNIWYVLGLLRGKLTTLEKILLLSVILVIPIWFINAFRMWTAFHVFMYGLLPFLFENKKSKLIFVFISFFIHFSFLLPISIVLIYLVLKNQLKLYFIFFILSIFISNLNIGVINQYIEKYVPEAIDERSSSYRTEDRVEQVRDSIYNSNKNWYSVWYRKLLRYSLIIVIIYFFTLANRLIKFIPEWRKLFSINLLFFSFANIMLDLPSGGRFLNLPIFLSLLMIILYLNNFKDDIRFKNLINFLIPSFLLFVIVSIRIGLYSTSLSTIIGNPIFAIFTAGDNISINDLIK